MSLRLSVLDQSIIYPDNTAATTLEETVYLAQEIEKYGYERFFVSEHHLIDQVAGVAPEVLVSYILAKTKTIKVGSAGVMLQHYSPFKVAEQFSLLNNLEPGRVVLGVGKAQGGSDKVLEVLQGTNKPKLGTFDEKLANLVHFSRDNFPKGHAYEEYTLYPKNETPLDLLLLGTSVESAVAAAELDISLVYAYFINSDEETLKQAREAFERALPENSTATFQLSILVAVTETEAEAEEYVRSQQSVSVVLESGKRVNLTSIESAQEYVDNQDEPAEIIVRKPGAVAGTVEVITTELERLSKEYSVDQFILHTPGIPVPQKLKTFEALGNVYAY